ncbi:MurR/RpiR family transcriptional regulator [Salinicola aestuarinus]|uniref:MurR/RpiR family transcriptional regulator n=1 Tax=Salinicola aestuarinus TaxID=1949082 RepID=UPI000DA11FA5|nr:MurR/RpiR family transcriptional regulator [Salinicola aestuarinus]
MSTRLVLAIQEHYERLSPSERKLATLLLDRIDDMLAYSAKEMADMAGVSKATAARLFRSLGYRDFNEVRLQAREERNRTQPFRNAPSTAQTPSPARGLTVSTHLQMETDSLARTFEVTRNDTLSKAAETLATAPRVWLLGQGLDQGLTYYLRPLLSRMRTDVFCLGAQSGLWAEELAMPSPRDVILMVLSQHRAPILERMIEQLTLSRVQIISVVDVRNTAWAKRFSQSVLSCYSTGGPYGYSAMSLVSMLHLLAHATAEQLGDRALQRTHLIDDIAEELDQD